MRKQFFQNSITLIFTLCTYLLLFFVINSCRKIDKEAIDKNNSEDKIIKRFFTVPSSTNPVVKAISASVKRQNENFHFINIGFVNHAGYPLWDKARLINREGTSMRGTSDSTDMMVYIPFVVDSVLNTNSALMVRFVQTDTLYKMLYPWQYQNYSFDTLPTDNWRSADVFHLFTDFNNAIFGDTVFRVNDGRIFGRNQSDKLTIILTNDQITGNRLNRTSDDWIEVCRTYHARVCVGASESSKVFTEDGCGPYYYSSVCSGFWASGGGSGSGSGWWSTIDNMVNNIINGGGNGGNGGSGSNGPLVCTGDCWWLNPCTGTSYNSRVNDDDPCTLIGWEATGGSTQIFVNQNIIDSLQGYPCAQEILLQLPSINDTAKSILQNVFGISDNVNIIFKADSTLPLDVNGNTQATGIQFDPNNGFFNIRIRLNTWVLTNSSKEFIAKTMFHEAIHALIDYHWKQYVNGLIDSTTFKQSFPKIWDYKKQPYSNLAQHTQIAYSYVDDIKSVIHSFNPLIADSTNRAISWSGLYETQAWRDLGNDTIQLNRLRVIARNGTLSQTQALNLNKCN